MDVNHTFVTSDYHFRDWTHFGGVLAESTKEEEKQHIALWNSVVGKDDLVLYIGDFCDGGVGDLEELSKHEICKLREESFRRMKAEGASRDLQTADAPQTYLRPYAPAA